VKSGDQMPKNWIAIDEPSLSKTMKACKPGQYVRLSHAEIPDFVPNSLKAKCAGALLMASGITQARTVYVLNLMRQDGANVDENPIVFVGATGTSGVSGFVYQHGSWGGRTSPMSSGMAEMVATSGVLIAEVFKRSAASGTLSELTNSSHLGAFDAATKRYFELHGGWPR
jgi:hypothetical protein